MTNKLNGRLAEVSRKTSETIGTYGDGISRPHPNKPTREYRLLIKAPKNNPLRVVFQAETKRHAIRYAKNRWPDASSIEVI